MSKLTSSVNTSLFNPKVVTNTSMISESGHWDSLRSRWRRTDSPLDGGTLENARVVLNFRFEGHIYKLVPDGHRHSSHQAGVHLSKHTKSHLNKHRRLYTYRSRFHHNECIHYIYVVNMDYIIFTHSNFKYIMNFSQTSYLISYLRGLEKIFIQRI